MRINIYWTIIKSLILYGVRHLVQRIVGRGIGTAAITILKLYQEILFLEHYFKGKYIVENVIPYYEPLIPAKKRGRHLYWANFPLPNTISIRDVRISSGTNEVKTLCKFHDYDFYKYKGKQPTNKIARNLVDYEAGKTILETALGIIRKQNEKQTELF